MLMSEFDINSAARSSKFMHWYAFELLLLQRALTSGSHGSMLTGSASAGYPQSSIFHAHVMSTRVYTERGNIAWVDGAKAAMRAALRDPMNTKFVTLSETGIPLYSPLLTYHQLMSESKSRVAVCAHNGKVLVVLMPCPSMILAGGTCLHLHGKTADMTSSLPITCTQTCLHSSPSSGAF